MKTNRTAKALIIGVLVNLLGTIPFCAWAEEGAKALVGSWKLTGWTVRVVGETEDKEPFGPNPKGRLVITPQGYWIVIITGANRHAAKTPEDKQTLFDSVLAYSGKYTVEGNKITVRVDMSDNEVFTGPSQVQTDFSTSTEKNLLCELPKSAAPLYPARRLLAPTFLNASSSVLPTSTRGASVRYWHLADVVPTVH